MAAQLRLVERPAPTPVPTNDNAPPWQGYLYVPPAPYGGFLDRIFALRFSPALLQRLRGAVIARSVRP